MQGLRSTLIFSCGRHLTSRCAYFMDGLGTWHWGLICGWMPLPNFVEHEYKVPSSHRAYLTAEEFLRTDILTFSDLLRLGEVKKVCDVTWPCLPTSRVKIEASRTPAGVCLLALRILLLLLCYLWHPRYVCRYQLWSYIVPLICSWLARYWYSSFPSSSYLSHSPLGHTFQATRSTPFIFLYFIARLCDSMKFRTSSEAKVNCSVLWYTGGVCRKNWKKGGRKLEVGYGNTIRRDRYTFLHFRYASHTFLAKPTQASS